MTRLPASTDRGGAPPAQAARLISASAGYYIAYAAVAMSALVSMPITTRLLSREEYGLLSLAYATVSLLVGSAQLGLSQATVRLLPEERVLGERALARFAGSMLAGSLTSSIAVALLATALLPNLGYGSQTGTLQFACALVITRGALGIVLPIFRALQRVRVHVALQIATRYTTVTLAVTMLLAGRRRAADVLTAALISEIVMLGVSLTALWREGIVRRLYPVASDLRRAVAYGFPLAVATASGFLIQSGDRFLIERFLGLDAVAGYTVAYDLTLRLAETAFAPVQMAVLPILYQLWSEGRPEEARRFVGSVATYVLTLALPLAAVFLALTEEIITLVASEKYVSGASLVPMLLPGIFIGEMSFVIAAGLRLTKQTVTAAGITLAGAALNVVLNLLFLPRWGLAGAAIATTVSYVVMGVIIYAQVRQVIGLRLRLDLIGKSLIVSLAVAAAIRALPPLPSPAIDVGLRAAGGLGIAALALYFLDRETRALVSGYWRSLRRRAAVAAP